MTTPRDPATVAAEEVADSVLPSDIGGTYQEDVPFVKAIIDKAFADQMAEIERLRAIVDKLPKMADGVAVVGGETVYANPENIFPRSVGKYRVLSGGEKATDAPWIFCGKPNTIDIDECYSTRQAAEAAEQGKAAGK